MKHSAQGCEVLFHNPDLEDGGVPGVYVRVRLRRVLLPVAFDAA